MAQPSLSDCGEQWQVVKRMSASRSVGVLSVIVVLILSVLPARKYAFKTFAVNENAAHRSQGNTGRRQNLN